VDSHQSVSTPQRIRIFFDPFRSTQSRSCWTLNTRLPPPLRTRSKSTGCLLYPRQLRSSDSSVNRPPLHPIRKYSTALLVLQYPADVCETNPLSLPVHPPSHRLFIRSNVRSESTLTHLGNRVTQHGWQGQVNIPVSIAATLYRTNF
jgi:hypothetical protein